MNWNDLAAAFTALFVIIDPIGLTPLFVALTPGADRRQRIAIAARAVLVAGALLTLFGLAGEAVLGFLGISMPAFRIAGGMLLFLTALDMLFERRAERREKTAAEAPDPSVFPLATPLIAGPGALTTMILLAGRPGIGLTGILEIHLVMIAVLLLCFLLFISGGVLERVLKRTGINVVTRLLGMLLAALSVQFVLDGLRGIGIGLPPL